jgi:ribosomal protein S14
MPNLGPLELAGFLIPLLLLALIPAKIASNKGYSFAAFYIFGVFLWLVAIIVAAVISPRTDALERKRLASGESQRCSHCAEIIRRDANVCRHCGRDVVPTA